MYTNEATITKIIMILKSLALNYPILNHWGMAFPKMIVVVTAETAKLISILKNFKSEGKKNSDFRFLIHSNNIKISDFAREYFQELANGVDTSMGLPIIITDNPIVEEDANNRFYIFIEDRIDINHIDIKDLCPVSDELEAIRKAIIEYDNATGTLEELSLFAASCFIRCNLNGSTNMEDYKAIIGELIEKNEASREKGNYTNLFIECLYKYQEINVFSSVYDKSEVGAVGVGNNMFYDEKFLYIPESLFKEIITPIRKHAPLYKIMSELKEDGLLITDNSKGYTVKLNCGNSSGVRPRVLRLNLSKLCMPARLSFIDVCKLLKEE